MTGWHVGANDKFDELRRAWIAGHQGWSTIQRRRAERLGRRIRARQRATATAVPDPHDDTSIPPLLLRAAKSPAAQLELMAVTLVALTVPLGWLGGWVLERQVVKAIPSTLRGYPIVALTWAGAVLGVAIPICYDPGPTWAQTVVVPWLCAQLAAVPAIAGVYGVLAGWLAVPNSARWWPLNPAQTPLTKVDAVAILGGYDSTGPGLVDAQGLNPVGERSTA
jgi:hypothetical protein